MFITRDIIFSYTNNQGGIDYFIDYIIEINKIITTEEVLEEYKKSIKANLLLISCIIDKNKDKKLSYNHIELIMYIHPDATSSIDPNVLYSHISERMTTQLYPNHLKNHTQFRGDITYPSVSSNPIFFITSGIFSIKEPVNDCILKPFYRFNEELNRNPEPVVKRPRNNLCHTRQIN